MPPKVLVMCALVLSCRAEPSPDPVSFEELGDSSKETSLEVGRKMFELGRETERLERERAAVLDKLGEQRATLEELERVVVFTRCVEEKSDLPFKVAFERGMSVESCRAEVLALSTVQLRERAQAAYAAE